MKATQPTNCGVSTRRPKENSRTTKLEKPLRREIEVDGKPYTVIIDAHGLKLVEKGRRKGDELLWKDIVSGDAALSAALNASLE